MAQIIRQLLDFARAGKPNKASVDLRHLVASTLSLLRPIADKRRVILNLETHEPVAEVVADAAQLQQVVTNLVVNAVQATQGPGIIEIGLRATQGEPRPARSSTSKPPQGISPASLVADRGIGMSEETLERIFEPIFHHKRRR